MATTPPRPNPLVQAGRALLEGLPTVAPTFVVVAMLACVLVPLPTALVDLLLSVSLAGAVLLLVGSLTIGRSTDFSNFPALLLLATLFRLSLNVSTTRLILSQADAGQVVDAFANIVVRGDLIVGGVMFTIITVVQYVVIARGAERVAEVAARFALDGLPGHQAAIDADLRAGVISAREASSRRAALAQRSSFYGAMDGAVRFVKGDAIAGLAITGVNLVGGLAIGSGRDGLGWLESLSLYGQLTVGDGLLAQIPALLVSLAAGVLVARVDDRREDGESGVLHWLQPAMLVVPAALLVALALVPGMPRLAFVATAATLLIFALGLTLRRLESAPTGVDAEGASTIVVAVHPSQVEDRGALERALSEVRVKCRATLAVSVPPVELQLRTGVPREAIDVQVQGRPRARRPLTHGGRSEDAIVLTTFREVMESAPDLVDLQVLDRMLEHTRRTHPVVVERALARVEPEDVLAVVRGFLRERVRVPPLRVVLGLMAEDRRFRDPSERSRTPELAREALRDHWVFAEVEALRSLGAPRIVRLTPDAEAFLLEAVVPTERGPVVRVASSRRTTWAQMIRARVIAADETGRGAVVLVASARARASVSALVRGQTPRIAVLSVDEMQHAGVALDGVWLDAHELEDA